MKVLKILGILASFIVLVLIGVQVYYFIKYDGNLIIYVTNQSGVQDTTDIKLKIDEKTIVNDTFITGNYHNWKAYSEKVSLGKHEITIKSDSSHVTKTFTKSIYAVNFILIELFDEENETQNRPSQYFVVTKKSAPFMIY